LLDRGFAIGGDNIPGTQVFFEFGGRQFIQPLLSGTRAGKHDVVENSTFEGSILCRRLCVGGETAEIDYGGDMVLYLSLFGVEPKEGGNVQEKLGWDDRTGSMRQAGF
jgi:hypothetical protein